MGKKSTLVVKVTIRYIFIIIVSLKCNITFGGSVFSHKDTLIFKIDFQEYFNNDTISMKLNNKKIIQGSVLSSYDGLAPLTIEFYEKNSTHMYTKYETRKTIVLKKSKMINLEININKKKHYLLINIKKGKYIGIGLAKDKNTIDFYQSSKPIYYD